MKVPPFLGAFDRSIELMYKRVLALASKSYQYITKYQNQVSLLLVHHSAMIIII